MTRINSSNSFIPIGFFIFVEGNYESLETPAPIYFLFPNELFKVEIIFVAFRNITETRYKFIFNCTKNTVKNSETASHHT